MAGHPACFFHKRILTWRHAIPDGELMAACEGPVREG